MRSAFLAEFNATVYEDGRIVNMKTGHTLKNQRCPLGYWRANVIRASDGKRHGLFVHRALALAFIPNPENKRCVNHLNGDKGDFTLSNLEWATHKENSAHATRAGKYTEFSNRSPARALRNKAIRALIRTESLSTKEIAELFGTTITNVKYILNRSPQ